MELKNLFEPIIFGKNEDEKDLISVPSIQDVVKYNLMNLSDFDGLVLNEDNLLQTKTSFLQKNSKEFDSNLFNSDHIIDLHAKIQINLQAYNHLKKYSDYQPCKVKKNDKSFYCVNLGKNFYHRDNSEKDEKLAWRILNWEEMPTNINPQGNGKAKSMVLLSMKPILMFHRNWRCKYNSLYMNWTEGELRKKLNGKCKKHESFIDNAFEDERMLLRTFRRKKTKVIDTNQSALKKQLITELQNNPQDWADLIPHMKNYIATMENEK